jgi:diguanylate cyclase (GGDEF)-like protein/PAS domain S-box-containing protein
MTPGWRERWQLRRLALGLALACLLVLGHAATSSLLTAQRLQARLDIENTLGHAQRQLLPALREQHLPALREAVRELYGRRSLGIRYLRVRDRTGVVLAEVGQWQTLDLPLLPAGVDQAIQRWLYQLSGITGRGRVLHEDQLLGSFDYAISTTLRAEVQDAAVARLRQSGWLGLAATLVLLLLLILLWRLRGPLVASERWAERLEPPAVRAPGFEFAALQDPDTPRETLLLALRQRVGTALDQLQYGLILTDREARVQFMNQTAETLTGWKLADAHQRVVYSVFHAEDAQGEARVTAAEQVLASGKQVLPVDCQLKARDGGLRPIEMMACLMPSTEIGPDGAAMIFRDTSEQQTYLQQLARQSRASQAVVDHLDEGLLTTDPAGVIRFANSRAQHMFGYTREELVGTSVTRLMPAPFLNTPGLRLSDYSGSHQASGLPKVVGWRKDATTFPAELNVQPMSVDGENGLVVIVRDISQRLAGESLASRLGRLLDSAVEEVYIFNAQTLQFLEINRGARRNLGYSEQQLLRMTPLSISSGITPEQFQALLNQLRNGQVEHLSYRAQHRRADGTEYPVEVRLNYSRDEEPPVFMAMVVDITERLAAEENLERLAHRDPLTGLPNRSMLFDRLRQALAVAVRNSRQVAVLFIDLDGFKQINDQHGHEVGDQVLQRVASRLQDMLRATDTVARLGGDEFVIIAPGLRGVEDAEILADKILERFREPLDLPGLDIVISPSIGIAVYPLDESNPENLIRHADGAMYQAKQAGRGQYRLFSSEIAPERQRKLELERELHAAVALNQLNLLLSPLMNIQTGQVCAGLASIWWEHLRHGRVEAPEVLGAANRTGMLGDIELWQIAAVCSQIRHAQDNKIPVLPVFTDVSGWQLRDAEFAAYLLHLLERFKVPPARLVMVLGRDGLGEAQSAPVGTLNTLKRLGVRFALRDLPLDTKLPEASGPVPIHAVLLSPGLIEQLGDEGVRESLRSLFAQAQKQGMPLIARGVATPEQQQALAALGCSLMSGPLFAGDLPLAEARRWLARHKAVSLF